MLRKQIGWSVLGAALLCPMVVSAQGVLVDVRPDHHFRLPRPHVWPPRVRPSTHDAAYRIEKLDVHARLDGQIAKVQVSQSFINTGSRQIEVSFVFPLPYDGAIDQLTLLVDGKEYPAKLLAADEARRIYEGYVRRNRDPALLEWIGTGMFKTSVFPVPAGARRTVTLQYTQLCRKVNGLTEWLFPLTTARYTSQPVDQVSFAVTIKSQTSIKSVYSPTHEVDVKRNAPTTATVSWTRQHELPGDDFRLLYDVGSEPIGASVLSYRPTPDDDGYFLLLVSPDIKPVGTKQQQKTVVFVVDKSGSMSGKKIDQAKDALRFVMNNLNDGDLFNIIAYDSAVESFQPELQRLSDKTRRAALAFVDGLYAGGSTNIDGALTTALQQLQDEKQPSYVVFLTDGLPTRGERNEMKIVQNARERNEVHARLFAFGVGYDVNSRLLDKLARECFGQSQYVRPNEDIETHVAQLYQRIGAPVLVDMKIRVAAAKGKKSQAAVNRVYPKDVYDLFAGEQLVLVGRYPHAGKVTIEVTGKVNGKRQRFAFDGSLVKHSKDQSTAYVEKLWALRRIGQIIDEIDLHGRNQELIDELVALATKHGIVTPYTSFLADDQVNVRDFAVNRQRAQVALEALGQTSGKSAFLQRLAKQDLQRASSSTPSLALDYSAPSGAAGAPAAPAASSRGRAFRSGRGGMLGGSGLGAGAPRPAAEPAPTPKVLHIGSKAFFWRNDRWEDSVLTEKQLKETRKLAPFSDAYFQLIDRFGKSVAKYLAVDQPLIVVLDGVAYDISTSE